MSFSDFILTGRSRFFSLRAAVDWYASAVPQRFVIDCQAFKFSLTEKKRSVLELDCPISRQVTGTGMKPGNKEVR